MKSDNGVASNCIHLLLDGVAEMLDVRPRAVLEVSDLGIEFVMSSVNVVHERYLVLLQFAFHIPEEGRAVTRVTHADGSLRKRCRIKQMHEC